MGSMAASSLLWGSLSLALPPPPITPSLSTPCGVPQGLSPQVWGQDELRLCWAGMSKGP